MRLIESKILRVTAALFCAGIFSLTALSQSTDQNFPSPITTSEINGTIKVRDIGDSRLTRYFYAFDGGQGDIFINVVTKNFSGDIDVFTADTLAPLTKMVIYADSGSSETGRLIYMRKAERLILRVEGRSPNDDPATFRIKFGGSFIALAGEKPVEAPKVTNPKETNESGIRVNSVGTIVEVIPKPQPIKPPKPVAKETVAVAEKKKPKAETPKPAKTEQAKTDGEVKTAPVVENETAKAAVEPKKEKPPTKPAAKPKTEPRVTKPVAKTPKPPKPKAEEPKVVEPKPDPLASIRLVVQLKDGTLIERPMSEVVKFSVDKGVLVVIAKDGKIVRYSILDVARVTIE